MTYILENVLNMIRINFYINNYVKLKDNALTVAGNTYYWSGSEHVSLKPVSNAACENMIGSNSVQ